MHFAIGQLPRDLPLRKSSFLVSAMLVGPWSYARWMRTLRPLAERHGLLPIPRDLLEKPLRPYLLTGLSRPGRVALLETHHRLADRLVDRAVLQAMWSPGGLTLARLDGRDEAYRLVLRRSADSRQEGEVELVLEAVRDTMRLARATFLLVDEGGLVALAVGGLQGGPAGLDKQRIVRATRDLGGLRPKGAVWAGVQALARTLGASYLYGVSRALHPIGSQPGAARRFVADYDGFWQERGGVPDARWGYSLPLSRTGGTAPPRKAAALAAIEAGVREHFATTSAPRREPQGAAVTPRIGVPVVA